MKRELAFALQSYSELSASLGRTRSSKPLPGIVYSNGVSGDQDRTRKRFKASEESKSKSNGEIDGSVYQNLPEQNSVVVATCSEKPTSNEVHAIETIVNDAMNGEVEEPRDSMNLALSSTREADPLNCLNLVAVSDAAAPDDGENQTGSNVEMNESTKISTGTPTKKLELKMSKKIVLSKIPRTVNELFATGLLEGYSVFYNNAAEGPEFRGKIKGMGVLCFCSSCMGSRVLNPNQFEIHACKSHKRAARYICLENGSSLLDVVKACRNSRLDSLEETIQSVIGPLPKKEILICQSCKGPVASNDEKVERHCKSCRPTMDSNDGALQPLVALRRSSRNATGNVSSQDVVQVNITEESILKPGLELRRSGRNATGGCSSPDKGQDKLRKDRSSTTSLVPSSPRSSSDVESSQSSRSKWKSTKRSSKSAVGPSLSKYPSVGLTSQQNGQWKITRKDQRLHRLVFEDGGLPDGTEVAYYSDGQKLLEGYKRGPGIFCRCCSNVVSASTFEAHAGRASRRKPYNYIYTSNGVSLHEFAVSLLKDRECSAKDNDDLCIICADGGDLLLCDGCPRAFHIECASLSSVPSGKWFCQYCQNMFVREKFVEYNANALAAGRVQGVDLIEQITRRCIRIVKSPEDVEVIACVLCRGYDFQKSGFGARTVIVCDQCEKEYHVGCLKEHNMADLKELPEGKWFCCNDCRCIFSDMQNLLSRGEEEIHNSLLNVIKQKHEEKVPETITLFDVKWRVLSGKHANTDTRSLLSKAVAIFHESFNPIVDSATGRDYIPSMVYGRNIRTQDFAGMYCAVLLVNSSVVSAGIFRVFGKEIAELPLVATSNCNQGKGYFQLLFSCIEKLLACLNVKNLVLPAAPEAESIWTQKFGFKKIDSEQLGNYRKICWQMLTFEGTCMLQKVVPCLSDIQQEVFRTQSKG